MNPAIAAAEAEEAKVKAAADEVQEATSSGSR